MLTHARTPHLQADIDITRRQIVESFLSHGSHTMSGTGDLSMRSTAMVPFDLQEMEDCYVIYVFIDACPWQKLHVTVRDGMLHIKAAGNSVDHGGWQNWCGNSSICFLLPSNANGDSVQAYCQNEFLKVIVRKT